MNSHITSHNGHLVIVVSGEIHVYNVKEFRNIFETLDKAGLSSVVLDCAEITYIDTAAISALHTVQQSLQGNGIAFSLIHVSDYFKDILRLVELTGRFTTYGTLKELPVA